MEAILSPQTDSDFWDRLQACLKSWCTIYRPDPEGTGWENRRRYKDPNAELALPGYFHLAVPQPPGGFLMRNLEQKEKARTLFLDNHYFPSLK